MKTLTTILSYHFFRKKQRFFLRYPYHYFAILAHCIETLSGKSFTLHFSPKSAVSSGHAEDLLDIGIEKGLGVARAQNHGGIRTAAGAADGNDIFFGTDIAGIHGHHGDFHTHLEPLTHNAQSVGNELCGVDSAEFEIQGAIRTGEKMSGGEYIHAVGCKLAAKVLGEFLGTPFFKTALMGHYGNFMAAIQKFFGGIARLRWLRCWLCPVFQSRSWLSSFRFSLIIPGFATPPQ